MSLEITEELIARQPPEAQAIIRALLAKIRELQDRLNQSPRNSSSPPGSEHPHAKPPRPKPRAARLRGGQPGHPRPGVVRIEAGASTCVPDGHNGCRVAVPIPSPDCTAVTLAQ
jgi:hypothetical protein